MNIQDDNVKGFVEQLFYAKICAILRDFSFQDEDGSVGFSHTLTNKDFKNLYKTFLQNTKQERDINRAIDEELKEIFVFKKYKTILFKIKKNTKYILLYYAQAITEIEKDFSELIEAFVKEINDEAMEMNRAHITQAINEAKQQTTILPQGDETRAERRDRERRERKAKKKLVS